MARKIDESVAEAISNSQMWKHEDFVEWATEQGYLTGKEEPTVAIAVFAAKRAEYRKTDRYRSLIADRKAEQVEAREARAAERAAAKEAKAAERAAAKEAKAAEREKAKAEKAAAKKAAPKKAAAKKAPAEKAAAKKTRSKATTEDTGADENPFD